MENPRKSMTGGAHAAVSAALSALCVALAVLVDSPVRVIFLVAACLLLLLAGIYLSAFFTAHTRRHDRR